MNQKLSDWASIAEIISSIAVVVTLLFLILGLRENTEVTRASVYDRNIDSMSEFRSQIISDPKVAELWQAFQDYELAIVEGADKTRLRHLIFMLFGIFEKSYFSNQYGVLGQSEWRRFEDQICPQYSRVLPSPAIADTLRSVLTEEFWDYTIAKCSE